MLRLLVMKTVLWVVLLASACAGPEEHRKPSATSALDPSAPAAPREPAGAVLGPDSPLDVGSAPTPAKPHHHHGSAPVPAPEPAPAPEPQKPPAAKPHEHHGAAAPPAAELVEDPVCHMKIDPAKAGGGSVTRDGKTYYFCSTSCRSKFEGGAK
jgi:YHS domain-containing protein